MGEPNRRLSASYNRAERFRTSVGGRPSGDMGQAVRGSGSSGRNALCPLSNLAHDRGGREKEAVGRTPLRPSPGRIRLASIYKELRRGKVKGNVVRGGPGWLPPNR